MSEKKITLKHDRFNSILVNNSKKLAGKWNAQNRQWEFDGMVEAEVQALKQMWDSEKVIVKITATEQIEERNITFCGYTLCRSFSRDGGAQLGDGVALLNGEINSGGSSKYYHSVAASGSVFKTKIPRAVLEKYAHLKKKFVFEIEEAKK